MDWSNLIELEMAYSCDKVHYDLEDLYQMFKERLIKELKEEQDEENV